MPSRQVLQYLFFVTVASAGGWLVDQAGIPIGWLIGSLMVTISLSVFGIHAPSITKVMPYVKSSIGALLGASVTIAFVQLLFSAWASIIFLLISVALTIGLGYLLLKHLFKLDNATSMLCSIPGGMTEMSLLSERAGCDQAQVAVAHLFRITLAVLTLPFIISFFSGITFSVEASTHQSSMSWIDWSLFLVCILGGGYSEVKFKLQAGVILIPFILCAGLQLSGITSFEIPSALVAIAQIAIGIHIGGKFKLLTRFTLKRALQSSLSLVFLQIMISVLIAFAATIMIGGDLVTYIISYAPGGLAEMSIVAVAMQLEAAFVAVNHLIRLSLSLLIAPLLLRWVKS